MSKLLIVTVLCAWPCLVARASRSGLGQGPWSVRAPLTLEHGPTLTEAKSPSHGSVRKFALRLRRALTGAAIRISRQTECVKEQCPDGFHFCPRQNAANPEQWLGDRPFCDQDADCFGDNEYCNGGETRWGCIRPFCEDSEPKCALSI